MVGASILFVCPVFPNPHQGLGPSFVICTEAFFASYFITEECNHIFGTSPTAYYIHQREQGKNEKDGQNKEDEPVRWPLIRFSLNDFSALFLGSGWLIE